jgi:hypothetical protein
MLGVSEARHEHQRKSQKENKEREKEREKRKEKTHVKLVTLKVVLPARVRRRWGDEQMNAIPQHHKG